MSFLERDPEMLELLGVPHQAKSPARVEVLPARAGDTVHGIAGGPYEGADRFDRELALWTPSMGSADDDILPSKDILDARSRDAARNDAFVKSGTNIHKDNIVGSQFTLNSRPEYSVLGLSEDWAEEFQEEVETKFTLWAESVRNWVDAARLMNFTGMVRLAVAMELIQGEMLATAEWLNEDDRPFRTAIQLIDTDRLSNPPHIRDTDRLRGGILSNHYGRPLTYYIRSAHPSDYWTLKSQRWRAVRARKPWGRAQVIHIYEHFRPEQSRGVSGMVAALKELRITKRFRDVVLQNAVVNATYAASIESDLPSEAVFTALGGGAIGEGDLGAAIQKYAGGYLGAIASYAENAKNLHLDGVRIPHLFPGTKLQLHPAGDGGPLGTEFEQSLLRYIAANLDISYEQLSRDYSQTNYSSIRAAMNETHKSMMSRKRNVADRFATNVYHLWLEEAIARGEITSLPRNAPNFWDGINSEAYGACDWIGASRGQVDELKETQAAVLRGKYNLTSDEIELARLGLDYRKVYRQRSREKKLREELDIQTDGDLIADNMMNAATGAPREKEARDEKRDGSDDNTDARRDPLMSGAGTLENDFMDSSIDAGDGGEAQ